MNRKYDEVFAELEEVRLGSRKRSEIFQSILPDKKHTSFGIIFGAAATTLGLAAIALLLSPSTTPTNTAQKTQLAQSAFAAEEVSLSNLETELADIESDEAELDQLDSEVDQLNVEEIQ